MDSHLKQTRNLHPRQRSHLTSTRSLQLQRHKQILNLRRRSSCNQALKLRQ
ncbi:MAG: hypothetical protein ABSH13_04460 [Candidatus Acidiferrum sp.]|jgi:hypothetical protein